MSVKLKELGDKLGMSAKELKDKMAELGFELKPKATTIEDDLAELMESELSGEEIDRNADTVQIYDEIFAAEREKEIVKSQRKKTAGKVDKKKTKDSEIAKPVVVPGDEVEIPDVISVKEFAEKTGINPIKIIGELMKNGILANINQQIDFETAQIIASDLNIKLRKRRSEASVEDLLSGNLEALLQEDDSSKLKERPPVVTIMGHVDHGKTKLLDAIRDSNVVEGEAGGITQHIGAYQVTKNGKLITFIDTPGHEAFTAMRARGAKVTDVAILVVAADEGMKMQSIEALNHIKDAEVPVIVAINKIDKEGANIDRVKTQLAENGLQPEDWGGDTVIAPVSAITGEGIPKLLELILLVAEMENLRANADRPAVGSIIETHLDKSLGPVATVLVNTGTLHVGDNIVVGYTYGRVKTMRNHKGKNIKEAPPSCPVQISGLQDQPQLADILQVVSAEGEARKKAVAILNIRQQRADASSMHHILSQISAGKLKTLKLVLKADTNGSLEAIKQALAKLKNEEVSIKIIHSGIGMISETDVNMAKSSGGIVIGFSVVGNQHVKKTAERLGVDIMYYQIIYKLIEDMSNLLSGLLEPEKVTTELGSLEVKQIFYTGKKDVIIGCKVKSGTVENKSMLRVRRGEEQVGDGVIVSLRKGQEAADKIAEGNDCGIKFNGGVILQEGDILESYKTDYKKKTFSVS